jgi:hypothetical protein
MDNATMITLNPNGRNAKLECCIIYLDIEIKIPLMHGK